MEVTAAPDNALQIQNTVYELKNGNKKEEICPMKETNIKMTSLLFESPMKEKRRDKGHPDK